MKNLPIVTVQDYINQIPENQLEVFNTIRETILQNLPDGFQECISYGMIGYVIPHSIYPNGYHCNPKLPLPFASIASQKNNITIHHMGLYADSEIANWFVQEFPKFSSQKPDMGKGCIRFKKWNEIPYELIGLLFTKISVQDWISLYELKFKGQI